MNARNTPQHYGWVAIALHWLMAVFLIGLYVVGDYMVGLNYYDPLYHTLPNLHKSIGLCVGLALLFRLIWKWTNPTPAPVGKASTSFIHTLAQLGHFALYALVIVLVTSGYLISTAKGKGIEVFGLFEVPALLTLSQPSADLVGTVHEYAALAFIILVAIHATAALMHHFYWKDQTLTRMLGKTTHS